ncbi:MAG: hypothetical protein K2G62_04960 [Oscillospiraceae bacterium]|nr:hypothetical protein [Oscillospiraceae bacterium]
MLHVDLMYCDKDGNYHCLLVYDSQDGDGILSESEGASYARYAQYISGASMKRNGDFLLKFNI